MQEDGYLDEFLGFWSARSEINRIWTLKEGKIFNPEYPDYFLNRIKEQGLFDGLGDAHAETRVDAKKHVVDVTLTFKADDPTKPKRPGQGRGGDR